MRYYRKLRFTFVAIAIVYTLLLNAIFLYSYRSSSQREAERALNAVAVQTSEYTDARFRMVQQYAHLLRMSDLTSNYLLENPEAPDRFNRLRLKSFLALIYSMTPAQSNIGRNDIAITKIVDDYAILPDSTGNLNYMMEQLQLEQADLDGLVDGLKNSSFNSIPLILVKEDKAGRPRYTIALKIYVGRPTQLYLFANFTQENLFALEEIGGNSFAVLAHDEIVAYAGTLSGDEIHHKLSPASGKMAVRESPSTISGMRYIFLAEPRPPFTGTEVLIAAVGILVLAFSLAAMHRLTVSFYSPIANILQQTDSGKTSCDEFEAIRKSFDALHTNLENMSLSLHQYYTFKENRFFHRLFTGLLPYEEVRAMLAEHEIASGKGPYLAVVLVYTETASPGTDAAHSLVYKTRGQILIALKNMACLFRVIDLNLFSQGLILRQPDIETLPNLLRNIILNAEPDFGLEIRAFAGESTDDIDTISRSFAGAMRLVEQSEYSVLKSKVVISSKSSEQDNWKHSAYYPFSVEQSLANAVIHGKNAAWKSVLRDLLNNNQQERNGSLPHLALMLAATVDRIMGGAGIQAKDIFDGGISTYMDFSASRSYDDLYLRVTAVLEKLEGYLAREAQRSSEKLCGRMTSFVRENYSRDISLLDLADYLNMSKNYVSSLFKTTTGQNFKDYLSKCRFERACEIIRQKPKIKLLDVAQMTGCNPDGLLRLFMRYTGMSPSEYQARFRQNEENKVFPVYR